MSKAQPEQAGLRIEYLPLSKVKRFDRNPKKHDVGALVTSIQRYGFRDAPIFDGTLGALVAGHGRLKALDELRKQKGDPPRGIQTGDKGEWLVPVQLGIDAASAVEAQAFLVDHNALTVAGGDMGVEGILRLYDQDGLGAMLKEMAEAGEMPVTLDGDDLDALLGNEKPALDAEPQIDRAAELQKKWGTERGQLWALGDHRLMCGDSTSREDVSAVIDGNRVTVCVTSPPYNQSIDKFKPSGMHKEGDWVAKVGRLAYADSLPEDEYQKQQAEALTVWHSALCDGGSLFYNHKNRYRDKRVVSPLCWLPGPFSLRQEIVWSRPGSVTQNARMFLPSDERIYWLYKGEDFTFNDSTEIKSWSTVWSIGLETNKDHAVGFPVELPSRCIKATTQRGDGVLEPYCGSGTTLIAAEQLNRRCYGIEISPEYVAVTLQRFADATGKTPELLP